jgi:hypothetical protein
MWHRVRTFIHKVEEIEEKKICRVTIKVSVAQLPQSQMGSDDRRCSGFTLKLTSTLALQKGFCSLISSPVAQPEPKNFYLHLFSYALLLKRRRMFA